MREALNPLLAEFGLDPLDETERVDRCLAPAQTVA